MKYKVTSGDFEVVIDKKTPRQAANAAIRLHNENKEITKLGTFTLIEPVEGESEPVFLVTAQLIEANTSGFGDEDGQYSRKE